MPLCEPLYTANSPQHLYPFISGPRRVEPDGVGEEGASCISQYMQWRPQHLPRGGVKVTGGAKVYPFISGPRRVEPDGVGEEGASCISQYMQWRPQHLPRGGAKVTGGAKGAWYIRFRNCLLLIIHTSEC